MSGDSRCRSGVTLAWRYGFAGVVGTARCAVRVAFSGATHGRTRKKRIVCSARSDAGWDIAARCPYQATRDTSDWLILYERENEIEMGAHAPRVPFSAPSRKTMSAPEDSVNRATRKSWTRGASSNTRGGCGTG